MGNFFKETSTDVYINNIRNNLPSLTDHDIQLIRFAFETGYNIGRCENTPKFIQESALMMLVKVNKRKSEVNVESV